MATEKPNFVGRQAPLFYQQNATAKAIFSACRDEFANALQAARQVFDNNFLQSLNLDGIRNFEKLFDIPPDASLNIEDRRNRIIQKNSFQPPFTIQRLTSILEGLWGQGNFFVQLFPQSFQLVIDINTDQPATYLMFQKEVRQIVPANIEVVFAVQYTYLFLQRNFTYEKLNEMTYAELSQYSTLTKSC